MWCGFAWHVPDHVQFLWPFFFRITTMALNSLSNNSSPSVSRRRRQFTPTPRVASTRTTFRLCSTPWRTLLWHATYQSLPTSRDLCQHCQVSVWFSTPHWFANTARARKESLPTRPIRFPRRFLPWWVLFVFVVLAIPGGVFLCSAWARFARNVSHPRCRRTWYVSWATTSSTRTK